VSLQKSWLLNHHPYALHCRSPSSDIDLCLQVPPSDTFTKENGVDAMTNLATKFIEAGLTDVDTVRLTARIPIVKFNVPYNEDGEEFLVECDLSLQNPLACLNTSLLHAYSKISQITCVLAAIIKRWAKNRNINNPSQHTLSSYGYVIMLIHFLTSCDFNKNGFVLDNASEPSPILPNLQLVDPSWAQNPSSGSYREISEKPKNKDTIIQHPTEPNYYVNSHFYSSELGGLQKFCSENHNDFSSLGALLASFFHYFAYDFDYKKHVISLNRMHSSPHLEREIKAEEDGWSLFRQGLAIEDPFEQFYDVAHVVKASNFSHMLREFSLAYTKIFDAACADGEPPTGRQIIDMICEPVSDNQKISES
jgi:terminal uridylyltransferase